MAVTADVAVIVVSWNTRTTLQGCLASLPGALAGTRWRAVVVDNASRDGSAELVRRDFPAVRLVESGANLGFAGGCNLGVRALLESGERAHAYLLLNPDTTCPLGSLSRLWEHLQRLPDAAAVAPLLVDAAGRPTASYGDFPRPWHHLLAALDPAGAWLPPGWRRGLGRVPRPGAPFTVDYAKGACLLLRTEVWDAIGPLDERFFLYFEESDWCRRARAAGRRTFLCPDVTVQHLEGRAAEQVSRFSLAQFQRSYRLWVAKHHGARRVALFRAVQFLEYGIKGMLRSALAWRSARDRRLAARHLYVARLQTAREIPITPPAGASEPSRATV
ncbi:MAG: glycosyltransferase family 2 protein [Candidatus Krumholzibacteriia bacterium]